MLLLWRKSHIYSCDSFVWEILMAFHTLFCFLFFSYTFCSFPPSNFCPSLFTFLELFSTFLFLHFCPFLSLFLLPSFPVYRLHSSPLSLLQYLLFSLYYTPFHSFSTTVPSSHCLSPFPPLLLLFLSLRTFHSLFLY